MADFQTRVDGLTGLTGGTDYSLSELTEYLKDGVMEVTNRVITLKPQDRIHFQAESAEQTSNNSFSVKGEITSVVREAEVNNDWRECRLIAPAMQSRVTDVTSLDYASSYNPAYTLLDNGKISVFPTPGSATKAFKVFYINTDPKRDSDAATLAYNSEDIRFFPKDKVYLVVLYSGIKCLGRSLEKRSIKVRDLDRPTEVVLDVVSTSIPTYSGPSSSFTMPIFAAPTLDAMPGMVFPSIPSAPTMSENGVSLPVSSGLVYSQPFFNIPETPTFNSLDLPAPVVGIDAPNFSDLIVDEVFVNILSAPPTFTAPKVGGATEELTAAMDADSAGSGTEADFLNFSKWFSVVGEYIEDEEDLDLAQAQLAKIQNYVQAYSAQLQANQADFQEEAAEYQAQLQLALKKADLDATKAAADKNFKQQQEVQEYSSKLTKLQQDVARYTAEVGAVTQKWVQEEYTPKYTTWVTEFNSGIQKYGADIQNELNNFNRSNAVYQAEVQKALQEAQLKDAKEGRDLQNYASEIQAYSAQVNKEVQRWANEVYNPAFNEWQTDYQGKLTEFQAKIGAETANVESDLQVQVADFTSNLQRYTSDVQAVMSSNQNKIADYSAKVQESQVEVQKFQMDYTWTTERLMKLQAEYDGAFSIMGAQTQQQQQERRRQ